VLDTSKAKDREVLKRIYYSINKEILNEDDKANFIPGSIIASNDINLKVDEVLNDKSFIYAGNDLVLDSKDITNLALNLRRDVRSFNEFKWKQQEWKGKTGKITGKKKWVTKGGKGAVFNFSYTDVGLPAVFAAGNDIVGSTQDFSSYALKDDIKLANIELDKFPEPIFNSPIIKNLNRRVKNQGYYYSLDSINSAYIANILDSLYEARNESISKFKNEAKDKNVKASALVMANNIELYANISLAGSVVADSLNLNSDSLNLTHLELNSKDINLKAGAANINSSDISAKDINIDANNISLDKELSQFSKASNLKADESLNLSAKENLNITGGGLEAKKINLNADNININAKEFAYSHSAKEKGISFKQSIQTLNSANLDAKDINLNSKSNTNISSSNLQATNKLNIEAGNDIYVVGASTNESTETKEKSKGFFSKKESQLMAINQKVVSSNLNAGDMSLKAGGNAIVTGSNLSAKNDINIDANNISINPSAYESLEYSQTNKKGLGSLMKSNAKESSSNYNLATSTLSAKDISLSSNTINALASIIEATNVDVNTKLLNLVSAKSTSVNTSLSNNAGILTATVKTKGKIEEAEIPAIIKVKDKFILNGKDITNKLDATAYKAINDSLNSDEFKEGVIRELRSNSNTPIDEETINQVKAVLNSKEWEDKTTTLSGMGALIITAIVTFLTAGAGTAVAGAFGAAASSTTSMAISAITTAVIANSTVQLTNNLLSHGKVKFDTSSLAKSAISAGVGSYVSNYISSIDTLSNTNIINTPIYTFSYADLLSSTSNAAINSAIYKINFKDTLLSNLISKATDNAYKAVGSYSSSESNINSNSLFKESALGKIALHSALGALSAKLSHENVAAGALSGAVNEAISSALHKDTSNMSTKELEAYNNKRLLASQLIGIIAGGIANGDKGANTGYKITTSADTYNRQLHQREIDFINNKNNIASFKSKLQTTTNKIYSDDEAKSILAKAAISLTDKSFNETYRRSLSSNDLYNIELATNFIKQSSFYNTSLDNTNAFNPDKKQYEDRYVYLDSFTNNREFYDKNLKVDTKLSDDITNFTTGFAKGGINLVKDTITGVYYLVSNPVKTGDTILRNSPDIVSALPNAIKNGLDKGELDIVLGDYESVATRDTEALGAVFGGAAIASKTGKMAKIVKDAGNEAILKTSLKISNAMTVDTVKISGREYAVVGTDMLTGSPIVRRLKNNSIGGDPYILVQNDLIKANSKVLKEGGSKIMTKKDFAKISRSKKYSPEEIVSIGEKSFSDFINSYAPSGLPEFTFAGGMGWILSDPSEQIKDSYFVLKSRIGDFINYIQSEQDK